MTAVSVSFAGIGYTDPESQSGRYQQQGETLQGIERAMTSQERSELAAMQRSLPKRKQRWKRGAENALVLWVASLLAILLSWRVMAAAVYWFWSIEAGWFSTGSAVLLLLACVLTALVAIFSSFRHVQHETHSTQMLQYDLALDLEVGRVCEEHYRFRAVKRFQEAEHGGLIYAFLTQENEVLICFDEESQTLGVIGEDPLSSSFMPCYELIVVRAIHCRHIFSRRFQGSALKLDAPLPISLPPAKWPEADELLKQPWESLEHYFYPD